MCTFEGACVWWKLGITWQKLGKFNNSLGGHMPITMDEILEQEHQSDSEWEGTLRRDICQSFARIDHDT